MSYAEGCLSFDTWLLPADGEWSDIKQKLRERREARYGRHKTKCPSVAQGIGISAPEVKKKIYWKKVQFLIPTERISTLNALKGTT